jgi:plastocyanin domain-containing protein
MVLLVGCGSGGDRAAPAPPERAPEQAVLPQEAVPDDQSRVAVTVDSSGYHPETIHARAGAPVTLVFTRTAAVACGEEVVFPDQGIRRALPVGQPVEIPITPSGTVRFTCGMDMMRGSIVAHVDDETGARTRD